MKWCSGVLVLVICLAALVGSAEGADNSLVLLPVSDLEWVTNPRGG